MELTASICTNVEELRAQCHAKYQSAREALDSELCRRTAYERRTFAQYEQALTKYRATISNTHERQVQVAPCSLLDTSVLSLPPLPATPSPDERAPSSTSTTPPFSPNGPGYSMPRQQPASTIPKHIVAIHLALDNLTNSTSCDMDAGQSTAAPQAMEEIPANDDAWMAATTPTINTPVAQRTATSLPPPDSTMTGPPAESETAALAHPTTAGPTVTHDPVLVMAQLRDATYARHEEAQALVGCTRASLGRLRRNFQDQLKELDLLEKRLTTISSEFEATQKVRQANFMDREAMLQGQPDDMAARSQQLVHSCKRRFSVLESERNHSVRWDATLSPDLYSPAPKRIRLPSTKYQLVGTAAAATAAPIAYLLYRPESLAYLTELASQVLPWL